MEQGRGMGGESRGKTTVTVRCRGCSTVLRVVEIRPGDAIARGTGELCPTCDETKKGAR